MAGNPCEELSPTGEKNKTEPGLTALFSGSSRIKSMQPAHKSHKCSIVSLVIYLEHNESSSHTCHSPELDSTYDNLPVLGRRV